METHDLDQLAQKTTAVNATDASQSAIGTSTAVDYNLASIHRNATIIFDPLVYISDFAFEPQTSEACTSRNS